MGEAVEHIDILAKRVQSLEDEVEQREFIKANDIELKEKAVRKDFVEADGAMPSSQCYDSGSY